MGVDTINGETLTIRLDSTANFDWIEIYSAWKDWLRENPQNRGYPPAFRTSGGDTLNDFLDQGRYWFLRNDLGWRIKPAEADVSYYPSGNLAAQDSSLPVLLPTDGAYTVGFFGLQPITQGFSATLASGLSYNLFAGGVHYDAVNGTSGTGAGAGTPGQKVDNFVDGLVIAAANNFSKFFVYGDATIDNSSDFDDFVFVGESMTKTTLTVDTDASVVGCAFYDAYITGVLDGDCRAEDCMVGTLNYINGVIEQCLLSDATITLGGGAEAQVINCRSAATGTDPPIIDMGASGQALSVRDYYGRLKLTNKSGTDKVRIDLSSGCIILDSTVTAGEIHISGVGRLTDTSGNAIGSGTWNGVTIVNELVNKYIEDLYLLEGLDSANPMTVTPSSRAAGSIQQTISGDGETTSTVTRTA